MERFNGEKNQNLEISFEKPYSKIVEYSLLPEIISQKRQEGKKIVLTVGIYDIVHYKHAESLACIKKFGNYLVVGIPGDEQIIQASLTQKQKKDQFGPIIDYEKRAKMISHLPYVDLIFKKTLPRINLLKQIKPDVWVQSITSGVGVIKETLDLEKYFQSIKSTQSIDLYLEDSICQIVFIDDIVDGKTNIIAPQTVLEESKKWEINMFSSEKFNGSIIKKRIIETNKI